MDFNLKGGGWIVEALKTIANDLHLRLMAYGVVLAIILFGIGAIRWW